MVSAGGRSLLPALLGVGSALLAAAVGPQVPAERTSFLFQVQGRRYERTVHGPQGELRGHQIISFAPLLEHQAGCQVDTRLTVLDPGSEGEVQSEFPIRVEVECGEPQLQVRVATAAAASRGRDLQVTIRGEGQTYPAQPQAGMGLSDLGFDIRVRGGVLSFLGTRTRMRISGRRVTSTTEPPGPGGSPCYRIESSLEMRLYVLGIPWRRERFSAYQVVEPGWGLVEEGMIRDDGLEDVTRVIPRGS